MMNWFDHCLGYQGGGMMMIGMIIFWGVLLFLGLYFLKTFQNGRGTKNHRHIKVLKERLASGKITEEEFDRLNKKLY